MYFSQGAQIIQARCHLTRKGLGNSFNNANDSMTKLRHLCDQRTRNICNIQILSPKRNTPAMIYKLAEPLLPDTEYWPKENYSHETRI